MKREDYHIVCVPHTGVNFTTQHKGYMCTPHFEAKCTSYLAIDGAEIIGCLVIQPMSDPYPVGSYLSKGTFVAHPHRNRGVATALWRRFIHDRSPKYVTVCVITDRGRTLVESLRGKFRTLEWDVCEGGDRPLRDLRSRKRKEVRV